MADFFKGLAGGFQTGLQFSDAMRRRQEYEEQQAERERLKEIFGSQPTVTPGTAATPEQIRSAGLETGRLAMDDISDFGLSAQEAARYAPQMPSETATTTPTMYSYGGLTRQTPFSAAELNRARMEQAIPVLAARNPAQALQMQETLLRSQREAERAPLEMEQLRGAIAGQGLSRRQAELQIAASERDAASKARVDEFTARLAQARRDNPNMTAQQMYQMAAEAGLSTQEQYGALSNITGIDKALFEQGQRDIQSMLRKSGGSLDKLVSAFNSSDLIGPGQNYRVDRDDKGGVTLTLVDAATGRALGAGQTFRSEDEAIGLLSRRALSPETVGEYVTNMERQRAEAEYRRSQALNYEAAARALKTLPPEKVQELNELSLQINDAEERGDLAAARRLRGQHERLLTASMGAIGKVVAPRQAGGRGEVPPWQQKAIDAYYSALGKAVEARGGKPLTGPEQRELLVSFNLTPEMLAGQAAGSAAVPLEAVGYGGAGSRGGAGAGAPTPQPGLVRPTTVTGVVSQARGADAAAFYADEARAARDIARRESAQESVSRLGLLRPSDFSKLTRAQATELFNSPEYEFLPDDIKSIILKRRAGPSRIGQ